jgi:hypothetical protein
MTFTAGHATIVSSMRDRPIVHTSRPNFSRIIQLSVISLIGVLLFAASAPRRTQAQTPLTCAEVTPTLQKSLAACVDTPTGTICAGSAGVKLENAGSTTAADITPGATQAWSSVQAIQTAPLDLQTRQWGTAILRPALRNADGNILQQTGLFLLYGDARLSFDTQNGTPTPAPAATPFRCTATTIRSSPLRATPSATSLILETVATNETVTILGVSSDGNWLFTDGKTRAGWIARTNLNTDCDLTKLTVIDPKEPATFPGLPDLLLKADGTATSGCRDIPPAGLLIQSPQGRATRFSLNGAQITLSGSAVFFAKPNNALRGSLIDGTLTVESNRKPQIVDEGQQVSIPLGRTGGLVGIGVPIRPVAFDEFNGENAIYLNTLCKLADPFNADLPCTLRRRSPTPGPGVTPPPTRLYRIYQGVVVEIIGDPVP